MTAPPGADFLSQHTAVCAVLLGTRISAMLLVAPAVSVRVVPRRVRIALAVLLTGLMLPSLTTGAAGAAITLPGMATEAAVGLLLGGGAAVLIVAAEVAGDAMSIHSGLSGAALLDPLQGTSMLVLTPLVRIAALTLLLSLNLHAVMLAALRQSLEAVPLGTPGHLVGSVDAALRSASVLFALGIQFAAPVIASALLVTLTLALLTRAAPQLNAFAIAFPIQTGAGLVATGAALTAMSYMLRQWQGPYRDLVGRILFQVTAP